MPGTSHLWGSKLDWNHKTVSELVTISVGISCLFCMLLTCKKTSIIGLAPRTEMSVYRVKAFGLGSEISILSNCLQCSNHVGTELKSGPVENVTCCRCSGFSISSQFYLLLQLHLSLLSDMLKGCCYHPLISIVVGVKGSHYKQH